MSPIMIFGITLVVFLLVIAGMAVGVLMGRRQLSGSCGGLANQSDGEGNTACSLCSNPAAACKELGQRMGRDVEPGSTAEEASTSEPPCDNDCVAEGCSKEAIHACKGD